MSFVVILSNCAIEISYYVYTHHSVIFGAAVTEIRWQVGSKTFQNFNLFLSYFFLHNFLSHGIFQPCYVVPYFGSSQRIHVQGL